MPNPERKTGEIAPVFQVKKKFYVKNRLLGIFQLVLILVVIGGTGIWLLLNSRFSFGSFFDSVLKKIEPEFVVQQKNTSQTPSQQLRSLLSEDNLVTVTSITATTEGDLQVQSKEVPLLIFSKDKNLADQVRALQTILAQAKISNRNLKKVDFRFDKVIVEY